MTIVGFDDFLDETMPHDIPLVKIDKLNSGDILENVPHLDKP